MPKVDLLTYIIPTYNESTNIAALYEKLVENQIKGTDWEALFVDDGSNDKSADLISALAKKDSRVKLLSFSKNFGQQIAIKAGLDHANGDAVIILDADLQDPPEVFNDLYKAFKKGFDVVHARRISRKGENIFKKLTSFVFYRFFNLLSGISIPNGVGDFRLMSKEVVSVLKNCNERDLFYRGLVPWVGFKQTIITFHRAKRLSGKTKFSFFKMAKLAIDSIISFSAIPLRISIFLGILSSIFTFFYTFYIIYAYFLNQTVPGYASIMVAILLLGSLNLLCLGLIGEYLRRIYTYQKQRPHYIIRQQINI